MPPEGLTASLSLAHEMKILKIGKISIDGTKIKDKVYDIIVSKMGVNKDQIKPESKFSDDLGADSLDTVELIMELENEFGVQIPDEDAEKIGTVQQAIDYIVKK